MTPDRPCASCRSCRSTGIALHGAGFRPCDADDASLGTIQPLAQVTDHWLRPVQTPPVAPERDAAFFLMLSAFRSTGGIERMAALAAVRAARGLGDRAQLEVLIAQRVIFAFEWHALTWIPRFQFDPGTLQVRSGVSRALAQLPEGLDGWTTARWFSQPHPLLDGHRPVDACWQDPAALAAAARAFPRPAGPLTHAVL